MMLAVDRPAGLPSFKRTSACCRTNRRFLSDIFTAISLSHSFAPTLFDPVNVAPPRRTPDLLKREASDEQALDDENPVGQRAVPLTPVLHTAFEV